MRAIVKTTLPMVVVRPGHYVTVSGRLNRPALLAQALAPVACGYVSSNPGSDAMIHSQCLGAVGIWLDCRAFATDQTNDEVEQDLALVQLLSPHEQTTHLDYKVDCYARVVSNRHTNLMGPEHALVKADTECPPLRHLARFP